MSGFSARSGERTLTNGLRTLLSYTIDLGKHFGHRAGELPAARSLRWGHARYIFTYSQLLKSIYMKLKLIAIVFVLSLFALAVACAPRNDGDAHLVTTQGK